MNQTVTTTRTKFIPWVTRILFSLGFKGLSWRVADWYMDRYLPWANSTMRPVSPVIPGHDETIYAKNQPEYNPLPSIKQSDGCVVTRWEMSWRERVKVFFTGSVYLEVLTFNQPLQPLKMSINVPDVEPPRRFEPADVYEKAEAFR